MVNSAELAGPAVGLVAQQSSALERYEGWGSVHIMVLNPGRSRSHHGVGAVAVEARSRTRAVGVGQKPFDSAAGPLMLEAARLDGGGYIGEIDEVTCDCAPAEVVGRNCISRPDRALGREGLTLGMAAKRIQEEVDMGIAVLAAAAAAAADLAAFLVDEAIACMDSTASGFG